MKAVQKEPGSNRRRARPPVKRMGSSSAPAAPVPAAVEVKKILVPIDFSEASIKALQTAVALGEHFGASLQLVHVVEPASLIDGASNVPASISNREMANTLHHKLVMLARKKVGPLIPVSPLVCIGKAYYEIVRVAQSFKADLIVIATRGQTGLKRAFLGSTAERVVRHAPCPVLVVRGEERNFAQTDTSSTHNESPT